MNDFPKLPYPYLLEEHIVYKRNKAIAILNPGIQLSFFKNNSKIQITGPGGSVIIDKLKPNDYLASLIAVKAIILGSEHSVRAVQEKLISDAHSRTTSYLCCLAKNCEEIELFYAKLSNCSIAIIGCGGIGSLSAQILVGAGIKKLTLSDHDYIEESNFNRQFFWTRSDIGKLKVDILKLRLLERYDNLQIHLHTEKVQLANLETIVSSVDAILFTADEPIGLLREARAMARKYGKKFVGAGYFMSEAVLSLSANERPTDERSIFPLTLKIAPSFGPSNVEIAGAATSYLLLLLGNLITECDKECVWEVDKWPWSSKKIML
jgi:hypothetical protein